MEEKRSPSRGPGLFETWFAIAARDSPKSVTTRCSDLGPAPVDRAPGLSGVAATVDDASRADGGQGRFPEMIGRDKEDGCGRERQSGVVRVSRGA